MMQTLRKYMKHILLLVILSFIITIIFSWGMGGFKDKNFQAQQGVVGIVDGHKIQYNQFVQEVERTAEENRQRYNKEQLSDAELDMVRDRVWEGMIQNILMAREIDRLGIKATAKEVVSILRNSPPEILRSNEQFITDGQFDMEKYQMALNDPQNYEAWIPVENYIASMIPFQKMQQYLIERVHVSDAEAEAAYRLENDKVKVRYLLFSTNQYSLDSSAVTDADIEAYYNAHREDYRQSARRKIRFITLEAKMTHLDSLDVEKDAAFILDELANGADFDELARDFSGDEASRSKGGDLGFFGKGEMVRPFEEAAFSAGVGEVVGPVKSQFGLHIIKIIARKREAGELKVHAKHILLKYEVGQGTYDAMRDKAQYIQEEIEKYGPKRFDELAAEENLNIKESGWFTEKGFIPGLGMHPRINYLAFQEKKGWISQPVYAGQDIIIFQISEIQPETFRPLEEASRGIRFHVEHEKKMQLAKETGSKAHDMITGGLSMEAVSDSLSVPIRETDFFALQATLPQLGRDRKFNGTAFRLRDNEISEPVEGDQGYFIIQRVDRADYDPEAFEAQKQRQKQQMQQMKQQMYFNAWLDEQKAEIKIEDFRRQYF